MKQSILGRFLERSDNMTDCCGEVISVNRDGNQKCVRRYSDFDVTVHAKTWKTTVTSYLKSDGSGSVIVTRNGNVINSFTIEPEIGEKDA